MITVNTFMRTFQLQVGNSTGTIFVMEKDDRQYWVTAKHVLDGWDGESPMAIRKLGGWLQVGFKLVGHHPVADVAVLVADGYVENHPAEASMTGLRIAQDLYFMGFPFGWAAEMDANLNRDFPMPFIKKAIVSAVCPPSPGVQDVLFLDGHNNPGFSGGPVVFVDANTGAQKICGVVSGYRIQPENVFVGEERVEAYVQANSGLMICEQIMRVDEVIAKNPIGLLKPDI